jgi:glutamyl-Q tRNA(Asp) synthetase
MPDSYRGRFAPSPTGPLHFGSLVAAAGSWLDARRAGGRWLVRMEDIDETRIIPGADALILRTLEAYGLTWDEEVVWQTQRHELYAEALRRLGDKVYACACSRKEGGGRCTGTCREGLPPGRRARAIRLRVDSTPITFQDRRLGSFAEILSETCGDFILRRGDGLYAYQLAVVVDDADQRITDIVRGADLLDSTARQIFLQQQLGVPTPAYLHLPVALNAEGHKLSKQTNAPPVDTAGCPATLARALRFLGIPVPADTARGSCRGLLEFALSVTGGELGRPAISEPAASRRDEPARN